MTLHRGSCHCGALAVEFETAKPLAPRECQCSFCRKHHARSVSDPDGSATITLGAEAVRYLFGTGSCDFLICGRCGNYAGAVQEIDGKLLAVLNLSIFDDPHPEIPGQPMTYEGETKDSRAGRRASKWTPAILREA
jgi:hypothetical protein